MTRNARNLGRIVSLAHLTTPMRRHQAFFRGGELRLFSKYLIFFDLQVIFYGQMALSIAFCFK